MSLLHRAPTPEELEVLFLALHETAGLGLMPIMFNEEQRFALVLRRVNEAGMYVQMLAVLTIPTDNITNLEGKKGQFNPPGFEKNMN